MNSANFLTVPYSSVAAATHARIAQRFAQAFDADFHDAFVEAWHYFGHVSHVMREMQNMNAQAGILGDDVSDSGQIYCALVQQKLKLDKRFWRC